MCTCNLVLEKYIKYSDGKLSVRLYIKERMVPVGFQSEEKKCRQEITISVLPGQEGLEKLLWQIRKDEKVI